MQQLTCKCLTDKLLLILQVERALREILRMDFIKERPVLENKLIR